MRKKKIGLYLGVAPSGGGTFQYCQSIIEALTSLPSEQYSLSIVYANTDWKDYLAKHNLDGEYSQRTKISRFISNISRRFGVPMNIVRKLNTFIDPQSRLISSKGCDLWFFPSQDIHSYLVDVPAITAIHDLMHRYEKRFPELGNDDEYRLREYHYSNICKFSKGILVDSGVGKGHVMDSYGVDSCKVHVLPFTAPSYIYDSSDVVDLGEEYGIQGKYIFYPAQFWAHKNHLNLIRATSHLVKKFSDFKLVFVGSKKNGYEEAAGLVCQLGLESNVAFLGYIPDEHMRSLYKGARAMVMASFCGPTNIPPLEAFVTGCPLAVSNVYAMPEQVADAAILFDPNSVDSIASTMESLWNNDALCLELAKKGRARADCFGQERFNRDVVKIISKISSDRAVG